MDTWSTEILGNALALYLMCLCAGGRCPFLSFPFCFFQSLNWSRENQSLVPSTLSDFLMPPLLLPSSCYHLEVLRTSSKPPAAPVPPPPLLLPSALGTIDFFVQSGSQEVRGVKYMGQTLMSLSFRCCHWVENEEGTSGGHPDLTIQGQVIPLGKSSSLCT